MFGKYQDITGQLNFYLFLLLAICLPFSYDLVRVMWTVWLISYIIEFPFLTTNEEGKIVFALSKSNFLRLDNIPLYAACLFVVWEAVSLLWTGADSYGFRAQHVTLLLLPIAAVCGFNKYYKWKTVARTLVVACVVSFFVYCFCFYWLQNINYLLTPFFEGTLEPFRFDSFVRFGQIKHHTFYCIIMLIAMVLCFFLFDDSCKRYGKPKAVIIFIVCQTVLLTAIIATMSRVALLLLPLLVVVGLIQNLRGRHRWIAIGGSAIVAIAVAVAVVLLHPRFEGFSLEQITQTEQHLHDEQTEPRLKIWSLALETPSDYLAHGMGVGSATPYMAHKYEEHQLYYGALHFGVHNQYLEVMMELGLAALLLFVAAWLLSPLTVRSTARRFATLFATIMVVTMMFDTILSVIQGVVYLGFTCLFILLMEREEQR